MINPEPLTQLVIQRLAGLTLFARQWLDPASAEDAVQEALIALLMQRHPPDNPVAWMFRTVRNTAIDHARSASRRRRREQIVAEARPPWFETNPDSAIDAGIAEDALRELAAEDRQVVVLRIWGELGFAEIAAITQLSLSTVHGRYVSALAQLRGSLEKPCRNPNK